MDARYCVVSDDCFFEFVRAKFFYRQDADAFARMLGGNYRVVEI